MKKNTKFGPEIKRVTLHPLKDDGTIDTDVNLYPKTLINGIIDESGEPVKVLTDVDLDDLKTEIAAEESRAIEAEEALQVNINEEIERASTKEEELKSLIDDEKESVDHIEATLQEEISRSTEEDGALRAAINAEGSRLDGVVASVEDLDERTSNIEASLDTFVIKEDGKGLSTNDFTDDDKSNLDNISDSIKVYNYFPSYSDGYIEVPVEAKQAFDIREISTKYSDDLGFSGQIVVDGSWHVFTFDEEYPIFNSDMKPVTLYQTGSPEDSLTLKYAYDNMNLETRTINRYCRVISLSEFVKAFATTDWGWFGTAANGRLTISHDKVSEVFEVATVGWKTNRIIDPNEVFGELVVKSISNVNFGIDNCKSISESVTNKATAIAALTSSDFDNVYIVFKRDNIEIESFEDYNITEVNYSFRLSSDDDTPGIQGTEWATFQLTYHSITDIFYNKDQTDRKFLTIESFNEASNGHEPIYKIGDLTDDNKLEARTAAEVYNILKSFNPQYPQYACAVFVPVSEDSEPITGEAVPFDNYTLLINQRKPLDTDPVTYEYGYRVVSQNKEYWLTKTGVKEITAATEEYVNERVAIKQDFPSIDGTSSEDSYFRISAPISSADNLREALEALDPEFAANLIGEPDDAETNQYIDNFGEVWKFERISEKSADVTLIVGDIKYTAGVSIEDDIETGSTYVAVNEVLATTLVDEFDIGQTGGVEEVYLRQPTIIHMQKSGLDIFLQKTDFTDDILHYRAAINNEQFGGDVIFEISISTTTDPETGDVSYDVTPRVIPIGSQPAESDLTIMTNPADMASIVHAYATGDSTGFKENHKYGLSGDTFVDFFTDSLNSEDLYWLMKGRSYKNRLIMFNGEKLKLDKSVTNTYRLHNSDDSVQITLVRAEKDTVTVNISDQFAYLEIIFFHYEGE